MPILVRLSRVLRARLTGWRLPLLVAVFVFLTSWLAMALVEPADNEIADARNYWWYFIVTAATVGYGDLFPTSTAGRLVGAYVIVGGIVTLSDPARLARRRVAQQPRTLAQERDDLGAAPERVGHGRAVLERVEGPGLVVDEADEERAVGHVGGVQCGEPRDRAGVLGSREPDRHAAHAAASTRVSAMRALPGRSPSSGCHCRPSA